MTPGYPGRRLVARPGHHLTLNRGHDLPGLVRTGRGRNSTERSAAHSVSRKNYVPYHQAAPQHHAHGRPRYHGAISIRPARVTCGVITWQ
jgi:hypothetical protein